MLRAGDVAATDAMGDLACTGHILRNFNPFRSAFCGL